MEMGLTLKVTDLGFSKILSKGETTESFLGTPGYIAPEIMEKKNPYNNKVDVYALGVIWYELIAGRRP
jgi:serine/threonine protein kinase